MLTFVDNEQNMSLQLSLSTSLFQKHREVLMLVEKDLKVLWYEIRQVSLEDCDCLRHRLFKPEEFTERTCTLNSLGVTFSPTVIKDKGYECAITINNSATNFKLKFIDPTGSQLFSMWAEAEHLIKPLDAARPNTDTAAAG
jgi:hypothetical protein